MNFKLPLIYIHCVDTIGSTLMLILAAGIFYESFRLRKRSFFHLYLFLLSCSLGTFAVSRASGHILKSFLIYAGEKALWKTLAPLSGSANTVIFVLIASLSFYYGIFRNLQLARDRERRAHLRAIRGARDFLQKVVDSLNTQLVVIDPSYRIVGVNRKFLEDFNLSMDEVVGAYCYNVLHRFCDTVKNCRKDEAEGHFCPWKMIREGRNASMSMIHRHRYPGMEEPRYIEISASPALDNNGDAEYLIETLTDVTDKIKMEEIERKQEKLTGVMEMATAVAHELNTPMFTVLGNAQLLKRAFKPDDPAQKDVEAILRNVKKMSRLTKQMTQITLYATKDYVDGEKLVDIMAASGSEGDVPVQEKARAAREERWLHLEKMAAMGQLTASVAHELNNALNIVLGYSQLLSRGFSKESRDYGDLKKIEKNAKQCQRIVAGLLDYTRSVAGERSVEDVNRHLEEVLRLVEHRMSLDGIEIVREFSPGLAPVMMDANEMKQVYLNLLNNAAQAMGKNGRVTVTTARSEDEDGVMVSISDTGPGIPPEIMDKISAPLFTTTEAGQGTGLGVNVRREIVRKHGGTLEAENIPEGGARFIIRLPVYLEKTGDPAPEAPRKSG